MRLDGGVGVQHTWNPDIDRCNACHTGDSFETLEGTPMQSHDNIEALLPELYTEIVRRTRPKCIGSGRDLLRLSFVPVLLQGRRPGGLPEPLRPDFDAKLLAAAYNYQVGQKDPAAYIHNGTYLQQLLYDSTVDLGGTPSVDVLGRGALTIEGAGIGLGVEDAAVAAQRARRARDRAIPSLGRGVSRKRRDDPPGSMASVP